jgi:hypothetical protein
MNTTLETDALIAADLHHLEDDHTCPASAYWRIANMCRDMERRSNEDRELAQDALATLRLTREKYGLGDRHVMREKNREIAQLRLAIRETLMENLHLADGDRCTLKRLKDAIGFDDEHEKTPPRDGEG